MKLQQYNGADCSLYRIPSIDLSYVTRALEEAITDAWTNDDPIEVDDLMNSASIEVVAQQLEASLLLQRDQLIEQVQDEFDREVAGLAEDQNESLAELDESIVETHNYYDQELLRLNTAHQETIAEKEHSHQLVEALRLEAKKKLDELGGLEAQGFLVDIKAALGPSPDGDESPNQEAQDAADDVISAALVAVDSSATKVHWFSYAGAKRAFERVWSYLRRDL